MDVRSALKSQYHAALAMLKQTIERCPDDLWTAGDHPRAFWQVAYHGLFFTHFYLQPDEAAFRGWQGHRNECETPKHEESAEPLGPADFYTKQELLDYWRICDEMIDAGIDRLDLDAQECGFWWYHMPKLDHQIMNIRHTQEHAGQLAERLNMVGLDLDWSGGGRQAG